MKGLFLMAGTLGFLATAAYILDEIWSSILSGNDPTTSFFYYVGLDLLLSFVMIMVYCRIRNRERRELEELKKLRELNNRRIGIRRK